MKDILLNEKFNLWILINQTRDIMNAAREKEVEKHGLSAEEQRLMLFVQIMEKTGGEKVTGSDIARWLFRKPSSISELLTRMEKRGLVQRVPDPDNKKSIIIKLTEKGAQLSDKAHSEGELISYLMSSLSEDERHQLWIIIGKLRTLALKELGVQKPPFPQFL